MPRPFRLLHGPAALGLSVLVVLSSAASSGALGRGGPPLAFRSTKASAAAQLRELQSDLAVYDQPIRMGTAVWLAMQARVKGAQAQIQRDRHELRAGPRPASVRRLRADIRRTERRLAPMLPLWIEVKAMLKRAFDGVKATLSRVRRVVAGVLGPVRGRRDPAAWRAAFHRPPRRTRERLDVCPVDGPYFVVDTFGAPRPGGRTHEGVDLQTARGTPILAALPGVAQRVPNTLGGNAVIVDSGGGTYTYYAHLSAYGASGAVAAGEIIGYAGASGDARGLIPHLHFELHPGGGDAVDAFPDLQAVC